MALQELAELSYSHTDTFAIGDLVSIKPESLMLRTFFDDPLLLNPHFDKLLGVIVNVYCADDQNQAKVINKEKYAVYCVLTSLGTYEMFDFDMEKVQDDCKQEGRKDTDSCS